MKDNQLNVGHVLWVIFAHTATLTKVKSLNLKKECGSQKKKQVVIVK